MSIFAVIFSTLEDYTDEKRLVIKKLAEAFLCILILSTVPKVNAQKTRYKMTTDIPYSITAPVSVQTRSGTLRFLNGFTDAVTVQQVFDNPDFQGGVRGFLTAICLPLKVISLGKQTPRGTAIGVGSVTLEAGFLDGGDNGRLAAVLDARTGTMAIRSRFPGTFGDTEKSFRWWAERLKTRIAEEKAGKREGKTEL